MRSQLILSIGLLSLGGAAVSYFTLKASQPVQVAEITKVFLSHEVTSPAEEKISNILTISGQLIATDTMVLKAKTNGTLLSLNFKEGDFVKTGQVLGEMDLSDLNSRRIERESAIMAARHAVTQAQMQHTANISLQQSGFIAETTVNSSASALETAKSQLKAAEAQMVAVNKQFAESTLISPLSGFIHKRAALPGEKLTIEQEIASIVNPASLELKAFLNPQSAMQLESQQQANLYVDGIPEPLQIQLSRIAPVSDSASRAIPVFFKLIKPPSTVKPGMLGHAQLKMPQSIQGLTILQRSVQEEAGKSFVWTIKDSVLTKSSITLGHKEAEGDRIAVIEGLDKSSVLLSMHFDGLKEGMKVTVEPQKVR